nr:unnamed protein product [Leishmania braziliensis]
MNGTHRQSFDAVLTGAAGRGRKEGRGRLRPYPTPSPGPLAWHECAARSVTGEAVYHVVELLPGAGPLRGVMPLLDKRSAPWKLLGDLPVCYIGVHHADDDGRHYGHALAAPPRRLQCCSRASCGALCAGGRVRWPLSVGDMAHLRAVAALLSSLLCTRATRTAVQSMHSLVTAWLVRPAQCTAIT